MELSPYPSPNTSPIRIWNCYYDCWQPGTGAGRNEKADFVVSASERSQSRLPRSINNVPSGSQQTDVVLPLHY